jgi:hypothetical protein
VRVPFAPPETSPSTSSDPSGLRTHSPALRPPRATEQFFRTIG